MGADTPMIAAIATFAAAGALFISVWLLFTTASQQSIIRDRLESVRKAEKGDISVELKLLRDEMFSSVPLFHRLMTQFEWSKRLQDFISQAGLQTRPGKILLVSGVLTLGGYGLTALVFRRLPIALGVGIVLGMVPFIVVGSMRRQRLRKFEERFPEALDLLGRAVRAGHAFTTGLEMVSREAAEPVAGEFRTTFEEQNLGLPLRDTLVNLAERVPLVDVRFLVTALLIQKETGGNLAEILDELARVIRDRFRVYREVRVKTAQGRLTAVVLILLPITMLVALSILSPSYIGALFHDPAGPTILSAAALMQVLGSIIIWKIVHIEV